MKSLSDFGIVQKSTFFIIYLFVSMGSLAQVKGTLVHAISKEPIAFATIKAMYQKDLAKYSISDSNGVFFIDTLELQSIHISRLGFILLEQTIDQINASNFIFEMTPVSDTLATVEVRAVRSLVQSDASKISYDVARDSTLKDRTAAEAISRLPFLSIDARNNVSYKNGRLFVVFVNGNRFGMLTQDPNAALKSIPASMIQSVELIFDPPLEYKLRGYDAVINIKTRPGYYKGVLGSMGGAVSSIGEWESEPYLSFQRNQTYVQLKYYSRGYDLDKSFTSDYIHPGSGTFIRQTNDFNTKAASHRIGLSLDHRLSSRSRFGVFVTLLGDGSRDEGQSVITTTKPDTVQGIYTNALLKGQKTYFDAGFDLNNSYGSKRSNYSFLFKYSREASRSISNSSLAPFYRDRFRQTPAEVLMQLGNSLNLKKNISIETVLRLARRRASSMFAIDTLIREVWVAADTEPANLFQFTIGTLTNAVSYKTKAMSMRLGFDIDYASYRVTGSEAPYSRDALNVLPAASAQWLAGKNKYLSLTYRTKLYRPTFASLASAVPNYDPLVVTVGNTQLGTHIEHRIAPEYSFYFGKNSSSAYATIEFDFSNSFFNKYSIFDSAANKRIISYRQSKYRSLYLVVGGDFEYSPKWSSSGSISVGFTKLGDNVSSEPVYLVYHSINYKMSPVSGVQLLIDYKSRYVTSMGYLTGYGTYDFIFYQFFLQRKLQVNLMVSNFLRKDRVQIERVQGTTFTIENINRQPFRAIQLSANLRFGQLKTFTMNVRKPSAGDIREIK